MARDQFADRARVEPPLQVITAVDLDSRHLEAVRVGSHGLVHVRPIEEKPPSWCTCRATHVAAGDLLDGIGEFYPNARRIEADTNSTAEPG
jgi:hypothetical protein